MTSSELVSCVSTDVGTCVVSERTSVVGGSELILEIPAVVSICVVSDWLFAVVVSTCVVSDWLFTFVV